MGCKCKLKPEIYSKKSQLSNYKAFHTKRLYIKPVDLEDAPLILELMNTTKWLKYIGDRHVRTIKEAKRYIEDKMLPKFIEFGYSNYVVINKKTQEKLGTCGLYRRDGKEGVDIGFAFLPKNENKGYGFEAANKLIEAAKREFGLTELSAFTLEENLSSRKLLERLGFTLIGTDYLPNNTAELLHYYRALNP